MTTFARVTRCKRCRTAFHDVTGRCPECDFMTRKGRKARAIRITLIAISVATAVLAIYVVVQNAYKSAVDHLHNAGGRQ